MLSYVLAACLARHNLRHNLLSSAEFSRPPQFTQSGECVSAAGQLFRLKCSIVFRTCKSKMSLAHPSVHFCRSQREKENLVADLKSAGTSQRVGPRASQKLHALFTATDPLMQLGELGFKG